MLARFLDVAIEMAQSEIIEDDASYWVNFPDGKEFGPNIRPWLAVSANCAKR